MAVSSLLLRAKPFQKIRYFSSTCAAVSDMQSSITNKQKVKSALTLFKTTKNNPGEQILYLCLSKTFSELPHSESSSPINTFVHEVSTQPSLLHSFIEELKTQPYFQKERFYSSFITVYGQARMFDHALKTFEEMQAKLGIQPSGESVNALISAGIYSQKLHELIPLLDDFCMIYGISVPVESYNEILKAYIPWGYCRYRAEILSLLNKLHCEGYVPNASTEMILLAGLYKEGPRGALDVIGFFRKRGVTLSIGIYNFAIPNVFQLNRSNEANGYFTKCDEAYCLYKEACNGGMKPNADTYLHLIRGYGEEGKSGMVRKVYENMTNEGVVPDRYCYETLMEHLCKTQYYDAAFEVCKNCLSEKWFPFAFFTDHDTMEKLVDGLVRISKHEDLIDMLEKKGLRPGIDLYNLAIESLCNLHRRAEAKALYDRMISSGKKPNSSTYAFLFSGLEKNGDFVGVRELYMEMSEKGIELSASSFKILMNCLVKEGRLENIDTTIQACRDCIPHDWFSDFFNSNTEIMNTLLNRLMSTNKHEQLEEVVQMLVDRGLRPESAIYTAVINNILEKVGIIKRRKRYCNEAREKTVELDRDACEKTVDLDRDCYKTQIKKLSQIGDFDAALCIWKDYCSKESPRETLLDLYNEQISDLCSLRKVADAKALFEGVLSRDMIPDESAFRNLIFQYCLAENMGDVKGIFRVIHEKGLPDERYCNKDVIKLISKVGDSETASRAREFLETRIFNIDLVLSKVVPRMREILNYFLVVPKVQGMDNKAMKLKERFTKNLDLRKEIRKSYEEMGLNPGCVNVACCLLSFGICYHLGALVF